MNVTINKLQPDDHGFVPQNKNIEFIDFEDNLDFDNIVSIDDMFNNNIESLSYNPTNKAAKKQIQTAENTRR